jgi:hypothetical protein
VNEEFNLEVHGRANFPDRGKGEFPFEHDPAASGFGTAPGIFDTAYGALCGCMQGNLDIFPGADAHVADDEGIHPGFLLREHLAMDFFKFIIPEEDVDGYEHARPELVRMLAQAGYFFDRIARVLPSPELRAGDIYGIGTAVDRSDADVSISCRSQKFQEGFHPYLMAAIMAWAFFRLLGLILEGSATAF